jgi:hypothetical protein
MDTQAVLLYLNESKLAFQSAACRLELGIFLPSVVSSLEILVHGILIQKVCTALGCHFAWIARQVRAPEPSAVSGWRCCSAFSTADAQHPSLLWIGFRAFVMLKHGLHAANYHFFFKSTSSAGMAKEQER